VFGEPRAQVLDQLDDERLEVGEQGLAVDHVVASFWLPSDRPKGVRMVGSQQRAEQLVVMFLYRMPGSPA